MKTAEDAELVRACRNGEESAFEALIDKYQRAIFNAALRIVNDREEAKDITQNVFLKAYENLASYDPHYRFYSWIYRIAVNESLNLLNSKRRFEPLGEDRPSGQRNPEDAAAAAELGRYVQEALMSLNQDYRVVIVLRHFLNCSYEDISHIIRVPEKTVKSRLFTARQILKDLLSQKDVLI
jgi:RNA polymerase sigma-70 factor (ECF subfamily)